MRGLVLDDVGHVSYRTDLTDPVLMESTDALVAVRRAGLCGSDLHPYEGREAVRFGVVPGHEFVGEVAAVGPDVTAVAAGTRVLAPFTSCCGRCGPCRRGLTARCVHGELFGYAPPDDDTVPALHGGQAELVRVPWADATLVDVPADLDDRAAVLLTDNLPTAWHAVERAEVAGGGVAVVVGLGAVGLCAIAAADAMGASVVLGVDPVAERRARAVRLGAAVATPEAARSALADRCGCPDGAPSVVDAAGTPTAQALAFSLVRPGGTLSVIAVQTAERFGFTAVQAYDANVTVRFGRASVRAVLDRILPWAAHAASSLADVVITDPRVPLADGPRTYRRFSQRAGGIVKAVFVP